MLVWESLLIDVAVACGAYVVADRVLASPNTKESFLKSGMFGKDLNKKSEDKVYVFWLLREY